MYSKNQWIKTGDRLNVQVNVQLSHDESNPQIKFVLNSYRACLPTWGILHESSVLQNLISISSLYNFRSDLNENKKSDD